MVTYSTALANIQKEDLLAGDLFANIFEYVQDRLIELSDKIPSIKHDERMAAQIVQSLIAIYLTGISHGINTGDIMRSDIDNHIDIIGKSLGLFANE